MVQLAERSTCKLSLSELSRSDISIKPFFAINSELSRLKYMFQCDSHFANPTISTAYQKSTLGWAKNVCYITKGHFFKSLNTRDDLIQSVKRPEWKAFSMCG